MVWYKESYFPFAYYYRLLFPLSHRSGQQTGSAVFSLPMFSWQDNHSRLNSTVALSYSSGNGLRVSDVASNVGQGWNLVGGGVIARMQVGEPDDQRPYGGNGTDQDISKISGRLFIYHQFPFEWLSHGADKVPDLQKHEPDLRTT